MELTAYLAAFKRQWIIITALLAVCVAAAFAVTQALPKTYEADAVLFVKVNSSADSLFEQSQFGTQRVKSYPDLIYSPEILNTVSDELGLGLTPGQLGSKIKAVNPVDTVYVQIIAQGSTPQQAAGTANLVAKKLGEQIRVLETKEGERQSTVDPRVTVPAVDPGSAIFPNNTVNLALGALIGLSLGLIGAIALDKRDTRLRTEQDVRDAAGLPVLGNVQRQTTQAAHAGPTDSNEFRDLYTNMLLQTQSQLPRILLFVRTSADLQSQQFRRRYAQFLTDTGRRVCVLDSDSRPGPTFPEAQQSIGFLDILAERNTPCEATHQVGQGSLTSVPLGGEETTLTQSDISRRAGTAIKELADGYDVLMTETHYESSPLNTAAIGPVSGAAVLLCGYGKTTSAELHRAALEAQVHGAHVIGVVVLDSPKTRRRWSRAAMSGGTKA